MSKAERRARKQANRDKARAEHQVAKMNVLLAVARMAPDRITPKARPIVAYAKRHGADAAAARFAGQF